MKVLMLGWEFPPHISGGLGTACHGITQGLSQAGVEVFFIVPRAFGDEDSRAARVIGCNTVDLWEETAVERGMASPVAQTAAATGTVAGSFEQAPSEVPASEPAAIGRLRVLGIDSPLQPYLTAAEYARRWESLGGGTESAETAGRAAAVSRVAAQTLGGRAASLAERLPELQSETRRLEEDEAGRTRRLDFGGSYGPDLMAEVARYALVVGELARRLDFDLVHAHDWMTYPAGLLAAQVSGKPLVVHMHATEFDRSGDSPNTRVQDIERLGLSAADFVVPVSHYTAGILRRRYGVDPARIRVVHNAVTHDEQIERWQVRKSIPEPVVLFLGRVTFQKGPDYFLEAAARVVRVDPGVHFVMSGSGDMLPRMIERAAEMGLARHFHFTGFLRGKDVERMYALADLYVMPSVSEPFGISPLEAMALDVPVIVSRQSGVAEILTHALKFDFWDVDDLANKILAVLRYSPLRSTLVEGARDEVGKLRWEASAQRLRKVYEEALA